MTSTREAKIHLPAFDNNGKSLVQVVGWLEAQLINLYGGFTLTSGFGGWKDNDGKLYREEVFIYTVAMEPSLIVADKFLQLALELCDRAEQIAIYAVTANGEVHFVEA